MPEFDPGDTRWLAERTRAGQREQHDAMKTVAAVVAFQSLPPGRQSNTRKVAAYAQNGALVGLLRPANLLPTNRVAKAGAPKLVACYDASGKLIGVCDPAAIEGLGKGESFSYDATGQLTGIIGSDGVLRPITPVKAPQTAATTAPTTPAPTMGAPVVAKAKHPQMTWPQAMAILEKTRGALKSIRVQKSTVTMDSRNLGAIAITERCLDELEPMLKMAAPPRPSQPDAEEYLRKLGAAVIKQQVQKSGRPSDADPMLVAATTYAAAPPAFQTQVRKDLAKTSVESRKRARRALSLATAAALGSTAVRKSMDDPGELRLVATRRPQ